jgi:soluble lytic murein transglycosylase-like protein
MGSIKSKLFYAGHVVIGLLLLYVLASYGEVHGSVGDYKVYSSSVSRTQLERAMVGVKIKSIAPHVSSTVALQIAKAVLKHAPKQVNLILSIIKAESDFTVGAVNGASNDYGLMQVNAWHIRRSGLDKNRLLTDVDYNIKVGVSILQYFLTRYRTVGEAVSRYNCGTRKKCVEYPGVRRYKNKVLRYKRKLDKGFKGI